MYEAISHDYPIQLMVLELPNKKDSCWQGKRATLRVVSCDIVAILKLLVGAFSRHRVFC